MKNADGYINYFEILGVEPDAKPGEVRKEYRRQMKNLVNEIASTEITEERRARYLLQMAQYNAAFYVLRDNEAREQYVAERDSLIELEEKWRQAVDAGAANVDELRRDFERRVRDFLSKYIEESMLDAGRDKDVVEASSWDPAHERHAFRILRHYRHRMYHQILERLPYVHVTTPEIDWEERRRTASELVREQLKAL
jgi:curved DNA-binding protein CbpA